MPLNHCSDRAHSDKANQAKVKAGMDESARLLEATGSCKFDLDTWWLPPQDEVENGDETMRETGSIADDTVSETSETHSEEMGQGTSSGHEGTRLPAIGDFVFFIAGDAPFLAAKTVGSRTTAEGDEVEVHWWSPSRDVIRNHARDFSVADYGKHAFTPDYVSIPGSRKGDKRRKVADVDFEPASSIVVSCSKLNGGNKIPKLVLRKLTEARNALFASRSSDSM